MALVTCPDCGQQMSDAAIACPRCGRPPTTPPRRRRTRVVILLSLVVGVSLAIAIAVFAEKQWPEIARDATTKKPNLETHCTMNGRGVGECTFTNTGTASGSVCGSIFVAVTRQENNVLRSGTICSGDLAVRSTIVIPFTVVEVNDACSPRKLGYDKPGLTWTDFCTFAFEESTLDDLAKAIKEDTVSGDLAEHTLMVTATVVGKPKGK